MQVYQAVDSIFHLSFHVCCIQLIDYIVSRPIIEVTIPSSVDPTLAPPGCHVVQLFIQYVPYTLAGGQGWTEELKEEFAGKGMSGCVVVIDHICQIRDISITIPTQFKITVQLQLQLLYRNQIHFQLHFKFRNWSQP